MSKINEGGPAFPSEQNLLPDGTWNQTIERGMTLREYFAAQAPVEIPDWFFGPAEKDEVKRKIKRYFAWRWFYADGMIESREPKS